MYKFKPLLKTLVWGTEKWVISAVPGSESVVAEGPMEGHTLSELFPSGFPLLIKFIDARQDLSIQVHPNDELAAKRHGCKGKTEMWYVIGGDSDAHLLSGLKKKLSPEEYATLVEQDRIVEALADYKVAEGDVFFLPAGRIHAIGAGCRIAEIQQTSDITYRIYDYGRKGLDGKPRELHTELAKDAIDYSVSDDYRTHYDRVEDGDTVLVDCPFFKTTLASIKSPMVIDMAGQACIDRNGRDVIDRNGRDGFLALVGLSGEAEVSSEGRDVAARKSVVSLKEGEAVLLTPADGRVTISPLSGDVRLLTTK